MINTWVSARDLNWAMLAVCGGLFGVLEGTAVLITESKDVFCLTE